MTTCAKLFGVKERGGINHTKLCNMKFYNINKNDEITIGKRINPKRPHIKKRGIVIYKDSNMICIKFENRTESFIRADLIDGTIIIL